MRQSTTNTVATQFKRQAEQISEAQRAEIVAQAQLLDAEGQSTQFFYNSTIQPATAVTKALKARFTYRVASAEKPVAQPSTTEENKDGAAIEHQLETNLITFSSNVLKVYSLPSDESPSIDLRLSTQFNSKILDVIRIPTEPFLKGDTTASKKAQAPSNRDARNRRRQKDVDQLIDTTGQGCEDETVVDTKDAPDYLFILLANFTVALISYSKKDHKIEVVSRGNISEKILHDQKEPPYPVFLGQSGTFIVLMLYHNILKVIPLVKEQPGSQHIIALTHATAVRVRHSNVMQVVPLYNEGSSQPTFGVVYQRTDHVRIPGSAGPPALQIRIELEKQLFDIERRDLTPHAQNGGKLEFSSSSVYKIESLSSGGFLAFDIDKVSYYRGGEVNTARAFHAQLKSVHTVTAFCQVDDFDTEKGRTENGSPYIRFLYATEAGELFMLAMHQETLSEVLTGAQVDEGSTPLINIEFLAQKLTFCSSLVYLDDGLIFYSSKEGDSFILKVCADHQGDQDQPYISIEQRFTSLAPIIDLQLARPENTQGQQSELVIVGGWNHQTNINLVKQGVGLRSVKSFESVIPAGLVQEYFTTEDFTLMRMYGYDQLVGMKVSSTKDQQGVIQVDGFDVSRNFAVKAQEQILAVKAITLKAKVAETENQDEKMAIDVDEAEPKTLNAIVYATNNSIKVLDRSGEQLGAQIFAEVLAEAGANFTFVKVGDHELIVTLQGGTVKHFVLNLTEEGTSVKLNESSKLEMEAEVSAVCLASETSLDLVYVSLFDAPHFSLNVLSTNKGQLRLLARMPLASVLESTQTRQFYQQQLVKEGRVFSQFKGPKKDVLTNLPGEGEEQMQIDTVEKATKSDESLTIQFNCSAARSIEHLTIKSQETDQILIGFASGKIMQLCLDLNQIKSIINKECPAFLDFQTYVESRLTLENIDPQSDTIGQGHEDLNIDQSGPFWGAQLSYVGTIHPKMQKIATDKGKDAVIACCDRPIVFYEQDESIEMHYLAFNRIKEIGLLQSKSELGDSRPLLLYEDKTGVLHLSENDNLRRLQVQRMVFKMQISKTLLVPTKDSIVVLLEQPNMDYIDSSKAACNAVGLVSRSTMRTQAVYQLQKSEIANCACMAESPKDPSLKWLLVGTAFLNPEETVPSMGRLLMLNADTMELVQEFNLDGSVQSVLVTRESRFLLLGVNNQIQAYDFALFVPTVRANTQTVTKLGKLDLLCSKTSGSFIQSIVKLEGPSDDSQEQLDLPESIIVGDMTGRGVSTFELKECRQRKVKIVESASTHIALWVTSIVALSDSQFIVFDQEGNLFIFQKNLYATCIEEKLKLNLKASFCVGEQVQSATFGSLRSSTMGSNENGNRLEILDANAKTQRQRKRKYVDKAKQSVQQAVVVQDEAMEDDAQDQEDTPKMIVTRGSVAKQQKQSEECLLSDPVHFTKILKDMDYAKLFAEKTLEEVYVMQSQHKRCSIVYGTADGSLNSLFQIPPKVYLLLQLLQHEIDHHINLDLVQQKRSEFRQVKQTPATITDLQAGKSFMNGIIDGDLIEAFLDLPKNKKMEYAKGMLGHTGKGDSEFTELLTQIVSLVKKST